MTPSKSNNRDVGNVLAGQEPAWGIESRVNYTYLGTTLLGSPFWGNPKHETG